MHRIAVVGQRDSIYGFAALGLEIFPASSSEEAKATVKHLLRDNVAIIFLTETFASEIYEELSALTRESMVAIIPIPDLSEGTLGVGMENLRKAVIKAVGTDIFFSK